MRKQAFSLVELSIVLVLLGLLVGGILIGQNLIRSAEMRAVITEFNAFQTATRTFQEEYLGLPGDMKNAVKFWGSAGGNGTLGDGCESSAGTGTETCNGDNDEIIDQSEGADEYNEVFTFWQHLANAGLLEGAYTGISGSGGVVDSEIGENAPASKVGNAGWHVSTDLSGNGNSLRFALTHGTFLAIGLDTASSWTADPFATAEEAWNIDKKMDDGKPAKGKVVARSWDTCTDAATFNDLESDYDLDNSAISCVLAFINAF